MLDWDDAPSEEHAIGPRERLHYERKGYLVAEIAGTLIAFRALPPADGTLTIQPKSDFRGRMAAAGGHANYGYSGYFRAYIFLAGQRKRLVDFWALFEHKEHHYAAQHLKPEAEAAIRQRISGLAGAEVEKVKDGYAFDPSRIDSEPRE